MATLPMAQPTNPSGGGGAALSPSAYSAPPSALASTVPGGGQVHNNLMMATGPAASTAGQPFGVPTTPYGTVPTSNATGFQAPSISSGLSTTDGSNTVKGDFKDTYGAGTGSAIVDQLSSLGTATNSAVQSTNDAVLAAAERQKANMYAQQAARGVSPDSSSSALYGSDFDAQVNSTLQSLDSNMELQGQNTLISSLLGEGQAHGPDSSGWDVFGDVLNAGAGIAGSFFGMGGASGAGSMLGKLGTFLGNKNTLANASDISKHIMPTIGSDTSSLGMIPFGS